LSRYYKVHQFALDPEPLQRVARLVRPEEFQTDEFQEFVQRLAETMVVHGAVGLAATQVDAAAPDGVPWAVFVTRVTDVQRASVIANPRILQRSDLKLGPEACVSLGGRKMMATMRAPSHIDAEFCDEDGRRRHFEFFNLEARVFCHEYDHLQGLTMLDRMAPSEAKRFLDKVRKSQVAA